MYITKRQKRTILELFWAGGDNRSKTVAEKVGVTHGQADLIISESVKEREEFVAKRVNADYIESEQFRRIRESKKVKISI